MPDKHSVQAELLVPIVAQVKRGAKLSELSQRDWPWDKHRTNADKVQAIYQGSEFNRLAERIAGCAQFLEFMLAPSKSLGELVLKLVDAPFCRVRYCPMCQWRRSLMWKAKAHQVLPKIVADFPSHRWLFISLTLRNCEITKLKDTIRIMNQAFQRMVQRKCWPGVGWLKSLEVSRSDIGEAHPHFHCLVMVRASYFSHGYLSKNDWIDLWKSCLRVDYGPSIDVTAVKKCRNPTDVIPELLKYCTKESDLVADEGWFLELTRQMHKVKCINSGGLLKKYLRELEQEPEDLIGKGDGDVDVDEGSLHFSWRKDGKSYRLIE